ncbi:hypothetical protein [Gottfriedia luciferensis]|uniref:hypothetical protein n=1 Tax=Gottfriedia luciferensis TaxID=178774 RepID=UPI000B438A3B|nr:hypothetical protein [Gottfriedia luciferensis]
MNTKDEINSVIENMSEGYAKNLLANVFYRISSVNGVNYTTTDCYKDLETLFIEQVGGKMIFK